MTCKEYKKWAKSNLEKCMAYDFKEEAFASDKNEAYVDFLGKDPIERFLIYRSVHNDCRKSIYSEGKKLAQYNSKKYAAFEGFDCDKAPLTTDIENALWPDTRTLTSSSDTMSSQQTTLNSFVKINLLKIMFPNEKHNDFDRQKSGLPSRSMVSLNYILFLYATQKTAFLEKIKQYAVENKSCIYDFFQWSDTIGNFIPVPSETQKNQGFNSRRESCYAKDYWDRTLYCIYRWYMDNPDIKSSEENDCWLKKLLLGTKNQNVENDTIVEACNKWLKAFHDKKGNPSWDVFVEKIYLQDYTEWPTRPYGQPKEFWAGHFSGGTENALPQTPEQFEAFFSHATACIKARSARMVAALRASVCNNNASPEKEKED